MSPNRYEMGKNRIPAPKVNPPISQILAGPMRFEHSSTVTKVAVMKS
jgi:hypothetical protein